MVLMARGLADGVAAGHQLPRMADTALATCADLGAVRMPEQARPTAGGRRGERIRLLAGMTLALLAHGAVIAALQQPNSSIVGAGGIVLDAVGIDIVDSSVLESRALVPTPGGDVAPDQVLAEEGDPTPPTPPAAETPPTEAKPRPPDETEDKKERREVEKAEVKPPPPEEEKPPEEKRETPPPPPQLVEPLPEPAPEGPPPPAKDPEPKPPEKPVVAEAPRPPEVKEEEAPKPREEPKKEEKKAEEEAPKPKPAAPPSTTGSTGGAVVRQSMVSHESGGREAASPGEKSRYQAVLVRLIAKARPNMRTIKTKARGTARVAFQLAPDGALVSVMVKDSSGSGVLDEAAMDAIRSVKFPPAPAGLTDKDRFFEVPFIFR